MLEFLTRLVLSQARQHFSDAGGDKLTDFQIPWDKNIVFGEAS
jgi:hypothetical protein